MRINQTKIGRNFSIDQNSASVTICNHMYDDSQSLLQYLYDDGKCGSICRGNDDFTSTYFTLATLAIVQSSDSPCNTISFFSFKVCL